MKSKTYKFNSNISGAKFEFALVQNIKIVH